MARRKKPARDRAAYFRDYRARKRAEAAGEAGEAAGIEPAGDRAALAAADAPWRSMEAFEALAWLREAHPDIPMRPGNGEAFRAMPPREALLFLRVLAGECYGGPDNPYGAPPEVECGQCGRIVPDQ